MGALTNQAHAAALDYLFSGGYTGTIRVRLTTTAPTQSANGTEVSTSVWSNYARQSVTANTTNFPAASSANPSLKSNGVQIDFATTGTPAVCSANVTLEGWEAWNSDDTVRLAWGTLASRIVQTGDAVNVPIGAMDLTLQPV
jgi:hypothetical protein